MMMMITVVLPLVYFIPFSSCDEEWCKDGEGIHENALDAFTLIANSGLLLFLVLLYWVSISFYNFFGLFVAKTLSAVHRTLIDASRTILVWGCEIIIFHLTAGAYGEDWHAGGSSILQLIGFAIMLSGIFIHNDIPGFRFDACFEPEGLGYKLRDDTGKQVDSLPKYDADSVAEGFSTGLLQEKRENSMWGGGRGRIDPMSHNTQSNTTMM